jgi:Na+/H+ antiporter NhaA
LPTGLRTFVLSVAVVDDFVALVVVAVAYSDHIGHLVALGLLGLALLISINGVRRGPLYAPFPVTSWGALLESGVDGGRCRPDDGAAHLRLSALPRSSTVLP